MLLKRKKKRYIKVTLDTDVLYDGLWDNLPIAEDIIIQKSIEFFNDKEPCAIHRGAVQIRLIAELDNMLSDPQFKDLFCAYTGFPGQCELSFSQQ
ncbi:hypothetical protein [Butyrivibrio fibrisolvens]|uniref:hypothetical protein n=1 Tax=Butyrivibrio fibrisolvens TaxID=831 RepID=UPI0004019673|nr:hypothetical protein [Butyrivibrio fibrisolvens]